MLNQSALHEMLTAPKGLNWVKKFADSIETEGFVFTDLLDLTLHRENRTAFHASWVLDTLVTRNLSQYASQFSQIIAYSLQSTNPSCHRQYARILMFFTASKAPAKVKAIVAQTNLEPVIEQCFDWLLNESVKVAVKSHAAETLFNIRHRYNWVADELQSQLYRLMQNGSPFVLSTGRRLLQNFNQNK
jgi:hypothetical protein